MPKPFPTEFRRDVIAVARQGDQSIAQVAWSFGISESCLDRWLKIAGWDAEADDVAALIHAHPTQNEAFGEAHLALAGKPLHSHSWS